METLLEIGELKVAFHLRDSVVHAVNGISYSLHKGETIGLVGESGCGKTVSSMSMLKLISMPPGKIEGGSVVFGGKDLVPMGRDELRQIRGKEIGVIFQDPMTAFNQLMTVGDQLTEGYRTHFKASRKEALRRAEELMDQVGIPSASSRLKEYPSQYSGGMRQRAMIAMALMCSPRMIIADEPTTALDVTIQAQILDLVKDIRSSSNMSILWVSHDLGVVAGLADRVLVMYAGSIVEDAPAEELYGNPLHPYTKGLLSSLPSADGGGKKRLSSIPGFPPLMNRIPPGCSFAPRCPYAADICRSEIPPLRQAGGNTQNSHSAACHLA
ncbi:ABC transporter ATP-binding protein [Treponema sp. OttesenSCG-928-L16]|nr:ABC transporter ATP-binding protein [Treponema sp. OttesenSCG-928-L16]